jgi:hypothetical protein
MRIQENKVKSGNKSLETDILKILKEEKCKVFGQNFWLL